MIPLSFYRRGDVVTIARELLGKSLFTQHEGVVTGGIITETEAYAGTTDRASHAYGGRRTKRTEVMYCPGGVAYVYLCYGIHCLLNAVTAEEGVPHAVLIRAIIPTCGVGEMAKRRQKKEGDPALTRGPGALSAALGITLAHNGLSLHSERLWISEGIKEIPSDKIIASSRIGVAYAGPDALLPYRFRFIYRS